MSVQVYTPMHIMPCSYNYSGAARLDKTQAKLLTVLIEYLTVLLKYIDTRTIGWGAIYPA